MKITVRAAIAVFLLDQISKYLVVHWLGLASRGSVDVFPPFLNFRMAWNRGINFGLGGDAVSPWILILVALAIVAGIIIWLRGSRPGTMAQISGGLLIGGALGNVMDRLLYGAVADFINMSCCGFDNPYSFNVADITVFAGAIGLILFAPGKETPKNTP